MSHGSNTWCLWRVLPNMEKLCPRACETCFFKVSIVNCIHGESRTSRNRGALSFLVVPQVNKEPIW